MSDKFAREEQCHELILVLLDVGIIRVGVCREWGLCTLFKDLYYGIERGFWAWDA